MAWERVGPSTASRPRRRRWHGARCGRCSWTAGTRTPGSMMRWRKRWRSAPRWTCCTTTARAAAWTASRPCCGSAADEAYRRRAAAPSHPGARRQAGARRARPRGEGRGGGAARCRHGSDLYGSAPDARDDRAGGHPGGRGRGRTLHPLRCPHDAVSARAVPAAAGRPHRRAADRRRHHPSGGRDGARRAGGGEAVRAGHADGRAGQIHRGMGRGSPAAMSRLRTLSAEYRELAQRLEQGGGPDKIRRQHDQGKLTARERLTALLDPGGSWLEVGLLVASDRYDGQAPAAGVVTGLGRIQGRPVVVVANDATVKAGSWWPETITKILRAQEIAMRQRIPIIYLVDSAGVNLPYQGGVFPGQYGAARIFYYNSIMRRFLRVPQIAAVMGPCIAGGAYLPALSDVIIMVEGTSFMGLGGPNLVKGAVGQVVDAESLGGASLHTRVSGVAHDSAKDDRACLALIRENIRELPEPTSPQKGMAPARPAEGLYDLLPADHRLPYDMEAVIACIVD